MALDEFWVHMRTAASFYKLSTQGDPWLLPRAVEAFRVEDFDFLDAAQLASLEGAIGRFPAIAREVASNTCR